MNDDFWAGVLLTTTLFFCIVLPICCKFAHSEGVTRGMCKQICTQTLSDSKLDDDNVCTCSKVNSSQKIGE